MFRLFPALSSTTGSATGALSILTPTAQPRRCQAWLGQRGRGGVIGGRGSAQTPLDCTDQVGP
jgi:hypothetical protein